MAIRRTMYLLSFVLSVTTSVMAADVLKGRIAGSVPKGSVWEENWQERLAILRRSPVLDFEYYIYGELGNEEEVTASLRRDRVQISSSSLWGLSSIIPAVAVLSLPYLFESSQEADFVYDCCASDIITPYLEEIGLTFMGWSEAGWTSFYGRRPLLDPDEVRGRRFRTPRTPSVALFFSALGVDNVYLGINDVVSALQTGLVEGGASSLPWYYNAFRSMAPHYTLTRHHYESTAIMSSKRWLESANSAQVAVLNRAFSVFATQRLEVREDAARKIALMKADGDFVYELNAKQRARWIAVAQAAHPGILASIGDSAGPIYQEILIAKSEFRQRFTPPQ